MESNKYYIPTIVEFHVGFEYEVFETKIKESYKDKKGYIRIPDFNIYSKEYFNELHSNDKYWEYRKWNKKICDKNTLFHFSSTIFIEKYKPLNIENKIRVKYLDKEDIESLGFKKISNNWWSTNLYDDGHQLLKTNNNYEISYGQHEVRDILFSGTIKNKSELKKLMKQLNINDTK